MEAALNPGVDDAEVPGVRVEDDQVENKEEVSAPAKEPEPELFGDRRYPGRQHHPAPTHFDLDPSTQYL